MGDINEDNYNNTSSLEVIDNACDDNDMNLDNSKGEVDLKTIGLTNDTTCSSQIHEVNVVYKICATFLQSTKRVDVYPGT